MPTMPAVFLTTPDDGYISPSRLVWFNATIQSGPMLVNATLYANFSGAWLANNSNATALVASAANISAGGLSESVFKWNIRACNVLVCAFNDTNRTLKVDYNVSMPTLVAPSDEASGNRTPVFIWTSVNDISPPVTYNLQVDQSSSFTVPLDLEANTTNAYYKVTSSLANNQDFWWRVRAYDALGHVSPFTPAWRYET